MSAPAVRPSWLRRFVLRALMLPEPDHGGLAELEAQTEEALERLRSARAQREQVEAVASWRDERVSQNHLGSLVEEVIRLSAAMRGEGKMRP